MDDFQKYQPRLILYYRKQNIRKFCKILTSYQQSQSHLNQYNSSNRTIYQQMLVQKAQRQQKYYNTFNLKQLMRIKNKNGVYWSEQLKQYVKMNVLNQSNQILDYHRKMLWMNRIDNEKNDQKIYQMIKTDTNSQNYFDSIVQKDLKRTQGIKDNKDRCQSILHMIAKYNPWIGYCQGFNNIIMFLIQEGFSQNECFSIWKYIQMNVLPSDYYTSMISMLSYVQIIIEIYSILHKQQKDKIFKNKQMLKIILVPFLICLFTRQPIQKSITKLFWDIILIQGRAGLIKVSLALMNEFINLLENQQNFQLIKTVEKRIENLKVQKHINSIKKSIKNIYINQQILDICMSCVSNKMQQIEIQKQIEYQSTLKPKIVQCDTSSHICLQQFQNRPFYFRQRAHECQVMKIKNPVVIVNNYLQKYQPSVIQDQNNLKIDDILIGRCNHSCISNINESSPNSSDQNKALLSQSQTQQSSLDKPISANQTQSTAFLNILMQNSSFSNLINEPKLNFNKSPNDK